MRMVNIRFRKTVFDIPRENKHSENGSSSHYDISFELGPLIWQVGAGQTGTRW